MDKALKVEIEKIINNPPENKEGTWKEWLVVSGKKELSIALTALTIKWIEERKYDYYSESGAPVEMDNFEASAYAKGVVKGRNQLITELIGELE